MHTQIGRSLHCGHLSGVRQHVWVLQTRQGGEVQAGICFQESTGKDRASRYSHTLATAKAETGSHTKTTAATELFTALNDLGCLSTALQVFGSLQILSNLQLCLETLWRLFMCRNTDRNSNYRLHPESSLAESMQTILQDHFRVVGICSS